MKTYIIQYLEDNSWTNLKDQEHYPIEFLSLAAATFIINALLSKGYPYPQIPLKYKIKDSTGKEYFI